jgi:hypothetical protein
MCIIAIPTAFWHREARVEKMSVRSTIISQFEELAKEQEKSLAALSDDLPLLESGLDSLCFAIVVARLEDALGFDPFSMTDDAHFPVTLGDFIGLYERAAQHAAE